MLSESMYGRYLSLEKICSFPVGFTYFFSSSVIVSQNSRKDRVGKPGSISLLMAMLFGRFSAYSLFSEGMVFSLMPEVMYSFV